ncbi:hypothetical protein AAFF_G00255400 [Aldrovandia affinis]|uniref:Uncharacterized protein n=1 Tax=Aldrovandia affinis TaxID=143900 RepID=A0AAD7W316_9TELE|nr:hypothetical protein AAFF_G00255400 [Aldrovandia affinis]
MAAVNEEDMLEDFSTPVSKSVRGRKRKKNDTGEWGKMRDKSKKYKADGKTPRVACDHQEQNSAALCQASALTHDDIQGFFQRLYENKDKVKQDAFILNHITVSTPRRHRQRLDDTTRARPLQVKYKVRRQNKEVITVCQKTFMSVLGGINRYRVNRLARYYHTTGRQQQERRGGSRKTAKDREIDDSIVDWIKRYKCRESHYGRGKSVHSYLPPSLNLSKMWGAWKSDCQGNDKPIASFSKFKKIFYSHFNLGFGNPQQDVCSFCEKMRMKIKTEKVMLKKQELITQLRVHKLRSKKFYSLSA